MLCNGLKIGESEAQWPFYLIDGMGALFFMATGLIAEALLLLFFVALCSGLNIAESKA